MRRRRCSSHFSLFGVRAWKAAFVAICVTPVFWGRDPDFFGNAGDMINDKNQARFAYSGRQIISLFACLQLSFFAAGWLAG